MSRTQWTPEEDAKLIEVFEQYSPHELALLFNRTADAVRQRAARLGMIRYEKKSESARRVAAQRKKVEKDDDPKTIYGCMPNPLIFLQPNWRTLAKEIRLRDTMSRGCHHWGTFVIGRGNRED